MRLYFKGLLLFFIIFLTMLVFLFSTQRGDEIIYLSSFHKNIFLVISIKFITRLGEAITFIPVLVMLFFISERKKAIYLSIIMLFVFLLVPLIKNIFPEIHRPIHFLETNNLLHLKPSWELHHNFSFPSGHTIAATTFFCFLFFLYPKKKYSLLLILIPFLVAFSRVFLFQHYLIDVVVGLLLGFLFSFFSFMLFLYIEKKNNE